MSIRQLNKIWFCIFVVVFLTIFFSLSIAHAQDLSVWVGKWFKLTYSYNGYETWKDLSHRPGTESGKATLYLKITAWDTTDQYDQFLRCSEYDKDEEGTIYQTDFDLHYLGGTDLDFLCQCDIVNDEIIGFTARIKGKELRGALKSATFKTLGGYYWERSSDPILNPRSCKAGGSTITGSLISESKLPPWVPK